MKTPKLLLIGNGYVGSEILKEAFRRDWTVETLRAESEQQVFAAFRNFDYVINAAGYVGKPNVDACELNKAECLEKNSKLPVLIAKACDRAKVPLLHISTGCIYDGYAKEWSEVDAPNFEGSFYSHSKAEGERQLSRFGNLWIYRLRMPFDGNDNARNYLIKLAKYPRVIDARNSATYLPDFVNACLDAYALGIPYGKYNIVNAPAFSARDVFGDSKEYFSDLAAFNATVAVPRSNCVLSNEKALAAGLKLRTAQEAVAESFNSLGWQKPEGCTLF